MKKEEQKPANDQMGADKKSVSTQFLTLEEAAQFLNLKVSRIRYEIFRQSIPFFKVETCGT